MSDRVRSGPNAAGTAVAIDEGLFVDIHGVAQWLTIRGADRENPLLLIIGGPGVGYSAWAPFFAPWEQSFTLVQWDQPGAGATFGKNGTEPLTLQRLVRDGIAVAQFACRHLHKRKIALLCCSGGTIVGLHLVQQRPELFSAYVGSGQVVDWARQDALSYELLLGRAHAAGDAAMLADLESIGAPPYRDTAADAVKSKYAGAPTAAEREAFAVLASFVMAAIQGQPAGACYLAPGVPLGDPRALSMAAYDKLRDEIVTFDARRLGTRFEVPMFVFQGELDAFTVTSEVERYVAEIAAPYKMLVLIPGAGHSAFVLRDEMLALLNAHVRAVLLGAEA